MKAILVLIMVTCSIMSMEKNGDTIKKNKVKSYIKYIREEATPIININLYQSDNFFSPEEKLQVVSAGVAY